MPRRHLPSVLIAAFLLTAFSSDQSTKSMKGYVIDSSCAITKNLSKPTSAQCAAACARKGSPLMILSDDGNLYLPVSTSVPSANQNPRLTKFAGQRVSVTGKTYESHGAKAIQIEKIEAAK
jgi:hypothetical protein